MAWCHACWRSGVVSGKEEVTDVPESGPFQNREAVAYGSGSGQRWSLSAEPNHTCWSSGVTVTPKALQSG